MDLAEVGQLELFLLEEALAEGEVVEGFLEGEGELCA